MMRPRLCSEGSTEGESSVLLAMDEAIRREKAQAALKPILDKMERQEAFSSHTNDALMCIECSMPCYESINTNNRRAYSLGNGTVICNECLCPSEVKHEKEV